MICHICEVIKRDLLDVDRALEQRKAAQASPFIDSKHLLELEIQALASARAQIEARYSQHKRSASH